MTHPNATDAIVSSSPLSGNAEDGGTGAHIVVSLPDKEDGTEVEHEVTVWVDPETGGLRVDVRTAPDSEVRVTVDDATMVLPRAAADSLALRMVSVADLRDEATQDPNLLPAQVTALQNATDEQLAEVIEDAWRGDIENDFFALHDRLQEFAKDTLFHLEGVMYG